MATKKKNQSEDQNQKSDQHTSNNSQKRLERSEQNKVIAGVAGGLGEYFSIDPTLVRLVFILLTIFGGSGILIYLIFWLIMPKNDAKDSTVQSTIEGNISDMSEKAKTFAHDLNLTDGKEDSKFWWGIAIVVFGFLLLFNNFGLFDIFDFGKMWPIILVVVGLMILMKKK